MSIPVYHSEQEIRNEVKEWKQAGQRLAFVPTMGSLHAGHMSLVERAKREADRVVLSIFVNPLQFGENEDFSVYPRSLEQDVSLSASHAVDVVFAPDESSFYPRPKDKMTAVEVPGLSDILCGASRPGHFRGVTTVVNKLFNIVQPDVAIFGLKDFQQFIIIRRMVEDLSMPLELIGVETMREEDGLAISSRNRYLTASERQQAPQLYEILQQLRDELVQQTGTGTEALEQAGRQRLEDAGFKADNLAIRCAKTLERPTEETRSLVILAAAWLGKTRLIDNICI